MKKKIVLTFSALALTLSLVACGNSKENVLKGEAKGYGGKIVVNVTKKDNKIKKISVPESSETSEIGGEAIKKLTVDIVKKGTVEGVDVVSGATVTSNALFKAIKEAK